MNEATRARYNGYVEALNKCSLLAQQDLATAWESLRLLPPEQCRDVLLELMQGIVPRYGNMAALAAAEYYEAERVAAGWPADFTAEMAEGVPVEQIEASTRYACGHLFEGGALEHDPELTAAYLAGKVDEYVKQGGRDTVMRNVGRDKRARYARIPDGNACDFCKMLGSRGFVYRSKEKAARKKSGGKYHPFCNCQVAVSFDPYVEKYQKGWTTVTRGYADDAEVVVPGRDGSYKLRDVDIDELFAEYQQMGRDFNKGSKYKSYTRGAKLPDEEFERAMERLDNSTSLDELHEVGKAIVDSWPKDGGGRRDQRQWDELSRRARELERQLKGEYEGSTIVNKREGYRGSTVQGVEEYQAFDKDGNPIGKPNKGTESHVTFMLPDGYEWKDVYASHTHPSGATFSTMYEHDGKKPSGDIYFLTKSGALGIDAVTEEYVYSMKRTESSNPSGFLEAAAREENRLQDESFIRFLDDFYNRFGRAPREPDFEESREARLKEVSDAMHRWYNEHAGEYGYLYSREPRMK